VIAWQRHEASWHWAYQIFLSEIIKLKDTIKPHIAANPALAAEFIFKELLKAPVTFFEVFTTC
jgi:hypothetical protein